MNEAKMIQALARVEDEATLFAKGEKGAVGFEMGSWFGNKQWQWVAEGDDRNTGDNNVCGTTACLAGHAVLMEGHDLKKVGTDIEGLALDILGISGWSPFYEHDLDGVYRVVAEHMGVDEEVLREKVAAERKFA